MRSNRQFGEYTGGYPRQNIPKLATCSIQRPVAQHLGNQGPDPREKPQSVLLDLLIALRLNQRLVPHQVALHRRRRMGSPKQRAPERRLLQADTPLLADYHAGRVQAVRLRQR